jgi:hypothetical protein
MQSASIAARAANSAKPSAKNINSVLMAIPRQQFVALQSKYLFHDGVPSLAIATLPETAIAIRDWRHISELLPPNVEQRLSQRHPVRWLPRQ